MKEGTNEQTTIKDCELQVPVPVLVGILLYEDMKISFYL